MPCLALPLCPCLLHPQDPGVWIHYDDSYVATAPRAAVLRDCQADGYLFFYTAGAPRAHGAH